MPDNLSRPFRTPFGQRVNPDLITPTLEEFKLIARDDAFYFDESQEAIALLSESDLAAIDAVIRALS